MRSALQTVPQQRGSAVSVVLEPSAGQAAFVVVTGPRRGRNAGGDDFFTDGRAHVLLMP